MAWSSTWPRGARHTRTGLSEMRHRVSDRLRQAGYSHVSAHSLIGLSAAMGVGVAGVTFVLTTSPVIGAVLGILATGGPWAFVKSRARRRTAMLREVWPEVVDHLASGVRAGLALPEAVAQIGRGGPVAVREPFRAFARDYQATGRFFDCLDRLKNRLADPVADRVIEALRVTRDVGGTDLGRVLRTLSEFLRSEVRTRGELEARQSWTVNAARLAVAAPWIVLVALSSRPQAIEAFETPVGVTVLVAGAAATVIAYRIMIRVGHLPVEQRVLR